jgi:hypothetical protein
VNLRSVHIVFIGAATALAALFGWWCLNLYMTEDGAGALLAAAGSFAAALGLVVYGTWFVRKTRPLR